MKRFLLFFVALLVASAFNLTSGQSSGSSSTHLDYLNFTALNGSATVSLSPKYGTGGQDLHCSFQYSVDDCATWINYPLGDVINLASGETVFFKATTTNQTLAVNDKSYHQFAMTGTIVAHGNVMSLLDASLTQTSVPDWCFLALFKHCSSLITPPDLPATQLSIYSYESMFDRCYNLAYPAVLPATYVPTYCYDNMFRRCYMISMNLSSPGYEWRFPVGATSSSVWAADMFTETRGTMHGTPNINQTYYCQLPGYTIDVNANDTFMGSVTGGGTYNLFDTVTLTATPVANHHFVNWSNGDTTPTTKILAAGNTTFTANFAVNPNPEFLHFTAVNGGGSVKLAKVGASAPSCSFQYSLDDCVTWNNYSLGTQINLASGKTVFFKAKTTNNSLSYYTPGGSHIDGYYYSIGGYHHFEMTGTVEAHGNLMSLLDATLTQTSVPAYAFYRLFEFCTSLTSAPSLPATQLNEGSYYAMFWECTALRESPLLPATSTSDYCYNYMFYACHKLAYPPVLPATNLSDHCYFRMLEFCYDITLDSVGIGTTWSIPSGLTPANHWGDGMFNGTGGQVHGQNTAPTIGRTYYYRLPEYTVSASANDPKMGKVIGGGSYLALDTVTLMAKPAPNHHFVNWSNGETNPTISFVVNGNTTLTANFAVNPDYLRFTAITDSGMVKLNTVNNYPPSCSFQYSTDSCYSWNNYTIGNEILLAPAATVYFKATTTNVKLSNDAADSSSRYRFVMSGIIEAHGNLMSLLDASLTQTSVPDAAFYDLFEGCSSMVTPPSLPATQLGSHCYYRLFRHCTGLVEAPELPAAIMQPWCYGDLFSGCSSLKHAPVLNSTSLADHCYALMFGGCTSLLEPPLLPATTAASYCYYIMFQQCTSLAYPPALPATTLADNCYETMFDGCTSLTLNSTGTDNTWSIPSGAVTASNWGTNMFQGTSGTLQGQPTPGQIYYYQLPNFTVTTSVNNATLGSVTAGGTYTALDSVTLTATSNPGSHFIGWSNGETDSTITIYLTKDTALTANFSSGDYLRFTAVKYSGSVKLDTLNSNAPSCSFQYSTDFGSTWANYQLGFDVQLNPGETVCFKATTTNGALASDNRHDAGLHRFVINGPIAAHGNIMSLLDANLAQTSVPDNAFFDLFSECRTLLTAPSLPATQLGEYCYNFMFADCENLLKAPALNAMTLAEGCYSYMFMNCRSLVIPPALPATTLAEYCYDNMFFLCTSLAFPPELPATNLPYACYDEMFYDCNSISLFTTGAGHTWSIPASATAASNWGYKMFYGTSGTMQGTPVIGQIYHTDTLVHVVALPNDTSMGSVSGHGSYSPLDPVTLTATPKSGYHFVSWSNGATSPTVTFVATQDTIFVAFFAINPEHLNFTAVNDSAMVRLVGVNTPPSCSFQYSIDHGDHWNDYTFGAQIHLAPAATVYFKATTTNASLAGPVGTFISTGRHQFKMKGTIEAHGNLMSLLDGSLTQTYVPDNAFYDLFDACSAMVTAPSLPLTELGSYCYALLFRNCKGLTEAPELPADTMKPFCYADMFYNCMNLKNAPVLKSTSLAEGCYSNMFLGCTGFTEPPLLPATTMAKNSYRQMFKDCSNLAYPPVLPATVLADSCYSSMFLGCTSISLHTTGTDNTWSIPSGATPATDWGLDMFSGTSGTMTGAPTIGQVYYYVLPVFTVTDSVNDSTMGVVAGAGSYSALDTVTLTATPYPGYYFVDWSNGVTTPTISFVVTKDTTFTANFAAYPDYLHFTAVNDSGMVKLVTVNSNPPSCSFQYSIDGRANWVDYPIGYPINLASGETVYFKATTTNGALSGASYNSGRHNFQMSGTIEAHGNIMSLIDASLTQTAVPYCAFYELFNDCHSLVTAPYLPATELNNNCYYRLFRHCTNLLEPPVLPAETMKPWCYGDMFSGCSSLQYAPVLNSTALADYCYVNMFADCSSLVEPPLLPATAAAPNCYNIMFSNCTRLAYPPQLPATTLASHCYDQMFRYCSSITLNTTGTGNTWSIPAEASSATDWGFNMFNGTNGSLQGEPTIGQLYYYVLPSFMVSANANDSTMGTVIGGGSYLLYDSATVTAVPNHNYHFVDWSNGATSPSLSFVVTKDTTLTAIFAASPTYLFEEADTICQGESLSWRGMSLTESGVYRDSFQTVQYGADSIYQMTLTVNPSYFIPEADTICQGQTYVWHSQNLTAAGVYYDSLLTENGCDSIHQLTLTVNPTYFIPEADTVCGGTPYSWHGQTITESGVYFDSLLTEIGCDSIHQLTLVMYHSYLFSQTDSVCNGGTYTWRGRDLFTPGVYTDSLLTIYGCDSVYQLNLSVTSKYLFVDNENICQGDSLLWRGHFYSYSGTYYDSLISLSGCDSIFQLNLSVNQKYVIPSFQSICQGDTFAWRGRALTETGIYADSLTTVTGCDSVFTLLLTVNRRYLVHDYDYICTGSVYTWHGRTLTTPGNYFDTVQTSTGCDSICILTLTQAVSYTMSDSMTICGESVVWRGMTITAPGTYYDSLVAVTGCDSVYVLNVGSEIFTVTAVADDDSHGYVSGSGTYYCGDSVTVYALPYDNYKFVSWSNGSTASTLNFNIFSDTILIAYFEVVSGVDNVSALNLEVASQGGYILLKGAEGHAVIVYDAVGKMIANIDEATEFETIRIPVAGIYILRLDNAQTLRVIVK